MAEKEDRQEGENYQSGRDGYKSYNNREGYNKYNRGDRGNGYERRPRFNSNSDERPQRPYRPRYNNQGEEGGYRPQRSSYAVITTVCKAKAATARNVLRTRPDIIRKRTVNNALTVRAITTVRRVKAAIVRHARTTPINRAVIIGRLWASARGASTYSRLQSECQIQQEETDGIQGGAG